MCTKRSKTRRNTRQWTIFVHKKLQRRRLDTVRRELLEGVSSADQDNVQESLTDLGDGADHLLFLPFRECGRQQSESLAHELRVRLQEEQNSE